MGYSPWGHKESDMTELLHMSTSECSTIVTFIFTIYFHF